MAPSFVNDEETNARYGTRYPTPEIYCVPGVYRSRLAELNKFYLEIKCTCKNRYNVPISALVRNDGGATRTLHDLPIRLQCGRCATPPSSVPLNECAI
ncbi:MULTISPECIES: hypothetical protein [Methylobacterium]|jgi:hypothetical protein|uniref:Uncharacterized protein n=2 Tax=Methylobacterium TaxID=407 RepID=A0A2R4WMA1_9HYPH|nr:MULTISPECIES: hypothetical protein [Methylobacterium]MBZ6414517.1 hypothetical protein [Methylobacterium sp.]AWB22646.1 hypothetical protein DA075_18450 [Methylobacterium currus]MBK3401058.1 hypothetical protein [Methylobacterium ajmalii]MBK3411262.1 hypothetical protein [Methylobacterium ajmalii]MBK3424798.1 hypothetical protein [Methylobacterium ajmalii]